LTDARELAIEKEIFALLQNPAAADDTALKVPRPSLPGEASLRHAYIQSLAANVSSDLSGLRVLVDCANGAATAEAPELFRALRIKATFLHISPDGKNINERCGALHPETLGKNSTWGLRSTATLIEPCSAMLTDGLSMAMAFYLPPPATCTHKAS
jgi:phosphoglucosamine mutase